MPKINLNRSITYEGNTYVKGEADVPEKVATLAKERGFINGDAKEAVEKPIAKMNKAELLELAEGLEVSEENTKAEIIEAIEVSKED